MAFVKKVWKDRLAEFPGRRLLNRISGTDDQMVVDVTRAEGTVSQAGDAFSSANMNDLEQRIADGFSQLNSDLKPKTAKLSIVIPTIGPSVVSGYAVSYSDGITKDNAICVKDIRCSGTASGGNQNTLSPWSLEFKDGYLVVGLQNMGNNTINNAKLEVTIVYLVQK